MNFWCFYVIFSLLLIVALASLQIYMNDINKVLESVTFPAIFYANETHFKAITSCNIYVINKETNEQLDKEFKSYTSFNYIYG